MIDALASIRTQKSLLIVCIAAFLSSSGQGLTNPVLSLYAQGFGVSTSLVGFFITTFAIGRVLVTLPGSRAADRWGRRNLLVLGACIVAVGAFGLASAPTFRYLLLFRLVEGIGSGLYASAGLLAVADLASTSERGRYHSLFQGSILLGLTWSPLVGGLVASLLGVRAPFYLHALLSILMIVFAWAWFPESLNNKGSVAEPARHKESKSPAFSPTRLLLSDRNFLLIVLAGFMIFVARAGSRDTLLPLLGQQELALDTTALGLIFTLIGLLNLLMIPVAGWVSDHLGRKPAVILGVTLNGLGLIALSTASGYGWFVMAALLLGAGKGFGEPSSIVYMTDISLVGRYGASFGLFLTLRDLGLFIGPIFLGWLADMAGLRIPLMLNGAVMLVVALLFALYAMETLRNARGNPDVV